MKKCFIAIIFLSIISTKSLLAQIFIDAGVKDVKKVEIIEVPFELDVLLKKALPESEFNLSEIEMTHYQNSPFLSYSVKSTIDKELTAHVLFFEGRTHCLFTRVSSVSDGNSHVQVLSSEQVLHYEYDVNEKSALANFKVGKNIDFTNLWQDKRKEYIGSEKMQPKCTDKSFGNSMTCSFKECADDWKCVIMCGLSMGPALCSIGFAIACS